MELVNEFTVPTGADEAFTILSDLERIASCLPGATLEGRNGESYHGQLGVRIGPVKLVMASSGTVVERDASKRRFVVRGTARERSGQGGAQAVITMTVDDIESGSIAAAAATVRVVTDLELSGRVAQFGGAAITQVNRRIMDQFVKRLDDLIRAEHPGLAKTAGLSAASVTVDGAEPSAPPLLERWGKLAPLVATVAAGTLLGVAITRAIRSVGAGEHRF
ncbi:SRPBCC family protein [Knoellia aerolata]|uniref:Carbon monoxide dehydrogenase subunit G n=1 Tax=Knoellia aerolata DSM 18566 TaxID=1385519 RepID=A0A0A0JWJ6_9MICO|nr:SRPBCC family protein [Knoellia aerolata]KGN41563.1 carbon monoxide dehydrogenase subunit G [Knoellia aerolata DSM 18566]